MIVFFIVLVLYVVLGLLFADSSANFLREVFWPVSLAWRNWDITRWLVLVAFVIGAVIGFLFSPLGKRFTEWRTQQVQARLARNQQNQNSPGA
jgi:RsiW-degrading membrane proteinase PrsW (M82 family)